MINRIWILLQLGFILFSACGPLQNHSQLPPEPYAVVFRSSATCSDCPSALGAHLEKKGFHIRYVGPGGATEELLKKATIFLIPGGEDCVNLDQCPTASDRENIRRFVENGGIFYGVCLGGFWAGDWPGAQPQFVPLHISGAHVLEFSHTPEEKESRLESITWDGEKTWLFYQDGPSFVLDTDEASRVHDTEVIATYDNPAFNDEKGRPTVAAFITGYGRGVVGVSGVHLEAPEAWQREGSVNAQLKGLNLSSQQFMTANAKMMSDFVDRMLRKAGKLQRRSRGGGSKRPFHGLKKRSS